MSAGPAPFDVVLFHSMKSGGNHCHDGFGVAWSVWDHARRHGKDIEAIGLVRGEPMPADLVERCRGRRVLMGDFAYGPADMRMLTDAAREFVLLDHHKSSMEELAAPGWQGEGFVTSEFHMNKSGALIAYEYLNQDVEPPMLIFTTSDRDLWEFKLEDTRAIAAYMQSLECTFLNWEKLAVDLENLETYAGVVRAGEAIERYKRELVDLIAEEPRVIDTALGKAAFVNSPCLQSELGERLAADHAFACVWWAHGDSLHMSFRSVSLDVSELARALGGGGHARAAGAQRPLWNGTDILDVAMVVAAGASKVAGAYA